MSVWIGGHMEAAPAWSCAPNRCSARWRKQCQDVILTCGVDGPRRRYFLNAGIHAFIVAAYKYDVLLFRKFLRSRFVEGRAVRRKKYLLRGPSTPHVKMTS